MGGAVAVLAAIRVPEVKAAVCFYGLPPAQVANPAEIKVPLQCHFANRDDWVSPEAVDGFEKALKAAHKTFEIHRYDADHAFVNEQRSVHDRTCAELAWERMLGFWKQYIG
jgi:carboxymethylenebutenolidase